MTEITGGLGPIGVYCALKSVVACGYRIFESPWAGHAPHRRLSYQQRALGILFFMLTT